MSLVSMVLPIRKSMTDAGLGFFADGSIPAISLVPFLSWWHWRSHFDHFRPLISNFCRVGRGQTQAWVGLWEMSQGRIFVKRSAAVLCFNWAKTRESLSCTSMWLLPRLLTIWWTVETLVFFSLDSTVAETCLEIGLRKKIIKKQWIKRRKN